MDLADLWRMEPRPVDALVEHYLPLVDAIVDRMQLPVERDDLVQDGRIGLMDAVRRFEPDRHLKFPTYAQWRIRGAVLDGVRSRMFGPRLRRGSKPVAKFVSADFGTRNNSEDSDGNRNRLRVDAIAPDDPTGLAERLDDFDAIVGRLPDRHMRSVVRLYYWSDLTMKEVAQAMGLSESRISQIHKNAMQILRAVTPDPGGRDDRRIHRLGRRHVPAAAGDVGDVVRVRAAARVRRGAAGRRSVP